MLGPEVQLFLLCGCHPKRPTIASSPVSGWLQVPSTLLHVLKIPRNLLDNHGIAPNCKTSGYRHVISFVMYSFSLASQPPQSRLRNPPWDSKDTLHLWAPASADPNRGGFLFRRALLAGPIHSGSFRSSMQGNFFIRGHCRWGYCSSGEYIRWSVALPVQIHHVLW